jgi:uncharacterized membrane protein YgaE (UPF0421/DUF939 family)
MTISNMLGDVQIGISGLVDDVKGFIGTPIGAAVGGAVVGGAIVGTTIAGVNALKTSSSKTSSKRKKIKHTKRGLKQDRARISKQKWEVAYQKRKRKLHKKKHSHSKSKKGIHYTKNGQPYKILASGKARFIKKH